MAGLKDNILFYFSGYGAQQPQSQTDELYEVQLAPVLGIVAKLKLDNNTPGEVEV